MQICKKLVTCGTCSQTRENYLMKVFRIENNDREQNMNDDFNIPDSIRQHLNEIAERLWAERAAVMVGSGFSKNAEQGFPDWNQLGDLFYHALNNKDNSDSTNQKYLNVLRLAEEYEAAVGRPALENLLHTNIPDLSIEPSPLHIELLELPWTDVFTTNYDTLLERASAKVVTRRYEPVVNMADMPYATKPRILKLHGSFPSQRPFIITEEDYRRYPFDFAPFVNTVRQSLLENTFCLIGFSGDDPNFLRWIGWIRDNLGRDRTQKIYLIGVFNFSSAKLQLLAHRGIIVVDFSCCEGIKKHDHFKALSLFFKYTRSKKPNALDWPLNPQHRHPTPKADPISEITKATEEWEKQRSTYPGWLILPYGNREALWVYTEAWVNYFPDLEDIPLGLDLNYAFELVWRLERCLLPIFGALVKFCEKILEKYWPFPEEILTENTVFSSDDRMLTNLPDEIFAQQMWLDIALAILRTYRQEGFFDKWEKAEKEIMILYDFLSINQKELLNYEKFLFSLFAIDLTAAKQHLENWQYNETEPYWMIKRAAGLAEIGLLSEAEKVSKESLEHIRRKLNQKSGLTDFSLVSQESYAMFLTRFIQNATALKKDESGILEDKSIQFNDRWNELKRFKCDPWNEKRLFELMLDKPSSERKDTSEKQEFDIGRVTVTTHFRSWDKETLNAYSFLLFCEEVGLPYRIGRLTLAAKAASSSLKRISYYSSYWANATLVRLGEIKNVDSLFSREAVIKLTPKTADQLIYKYLDALNNCHHDIETKNAFQNDSFGLRLAQLLPEVISRLCCKCSFDTKRHILDFVSSIYSSPNKIHYRNMKYLTSRLLGSMSKKERYVLIPDLLNIPFPDYSSPVIEDAFPNPFVYLKLNEEPANVEKLTIPPEVVEKLLQQAKMKNEGLRRWVISSFVPLYELNLLGESQIKLFMDEIWRVTDKFGLPDGTNYYKYSFVNLPPPKNVNPSRLLKDYFMSASFPINKGEVNKGVEITRGNIHLVEEIIFASKSIEKFWAEDDVEIFLDRILEWWDADKDELKRREENIPLGFSSIVEEFEARFNHINELLTIVVSPLITPKSSSEVIASLARLLKEIKEYDLPSLKAETACLHVFPQQRDDVYDRIKESLTSSKDSIVVDALEAIAYIIVNSPNSDTNVEDSSLISMFQQYITWCPTYSIIPAFSILIRILRNNPIKLLPILEGSVFQRLDKLLIETSYDIDNECLNFEKKLEVRRISSVLTARLWSYYKSKELTVPKIIGEWRNACLSPNEFAEIRIPWEEQ